MTYNGFKRDKDAVKEEWFEWGSNSICGLFDLQTSWQDTYIYIYIYMYTQNIYIYIYKKENLSILYIIFD